MCIPRTIELVKKRILQGEREVATLREIALQSLQSEDITLFYAQFCNHKLEPITHIVENKSIFLIAAKVGQTRLLDNLWI